MSSWEGNNSLHLRGVEDKVAFSMNELPPIHFWPIFFLYVSFTCKLRRRYDNFTTNTTLRLRSSMEKVEFFLFVYAYDDKVEVWIEALNATNSKISWLSTKKENKFPYTTDTKIRINWISSSQAHDASLSLIYPHVNGNFSRVHLHVRRTALEWDKNRHRVRVPFFILII